MLAWRAREEKMTNVSLLVSHVLVPPALEAILASPENRVQGFLGPGHVCAVMGYTEYVPISARYHVAHRGHRLRAAGHPQGVLMTVKQLEEGRGVVENQYSRILDQTGNLPAQKLIGKVFEVSDRKWRGIGTIPRSGYRLREEFAAHDAEKLFDVAEIATLEPEICISGQILRGIKKPHDCPAFGTLCTPQHPLGATMVSAEGACAAYYAYGRHLKPQGADALHQIATTTDEAASIERRKSVSRWLSQKTRLTRKTQETETLVSPFFGSCPIPIFEHKQIVLGHGSGGKLTADLIDKIFLPAFRNPVLDKLDDQAVLTIGGARLAFTTDSFVVTPIFFPGGDIGRLAVHGTVNDLAMSGARPLYLSAAFILEEGLPVDDLRRVVESMRAAAADAGVQFVTGDTKVVDRGKGDQIFITTTGIGSHRNRHQHLCRPRPTGRSKSSLAATSATMAWPSCRSARAWNSKAPSRATAPP